MSLPSVSDLGAPWTAGRSVALLLAMVLALATLVGTAIVVAPTVALGLTGLAVLLSLLLRASSWSVLYLIGVALCQPLLLRLTPETAEHWLTLKRLDEFSLAVLAPLAVLRLLNERRLPFPRNTVVGLAVVAVIGVIGVAINKTPAEVALLDGFLLAKGFLFFVIVSAFSPDLTKTRLLGAAVLVFALFAAVIGFIELIAVDAVRTMLPLARAGLRHGLVCIISVFDGEGQAGWFFAFTATVCFAFYLVYRRFGLLALFGLFAACSVLTLRRKPVGGLLLMMIVAALLGTRFSQRLRVSLLLLLAVATVLFSMGDVISPIFVEGYEQYLSPSDPYKVARNAMYITSFRLAVDYFPFGPGFGLFGGFASQMYYSNIYYEYGLSKVWGLSPEYSRYMMDAFWPHVLGQFGFFGLAAFMAALVGIWWPVFQAYRQAHTPLVRALTLAAILTFFEALVESSAESTFESTLSCFMVFGLAALALAAARREPAGAIA